MQDCSLVTREIMFVEKALNVLSQHWEKRATVKNDKSARYYESCFDPKLEDFKESLLPFKDHPCWIDAPSELKSKTLSWGWLIYNQKTIHIEVEIINPVLEDILLDKVPGATDQLSKKVVSETYVDEAYHTLMAVNACNIIATERKLQKISLPNFDLVMLQGQYMEKIGNKSEEMLIRLATASVSETMISSYLEVLSKERNINKLCWMTVDAHRKDELAHANLFMGIMKKIFPNLNKAQKTRYLSMLPCAIRWFSSQELNVWSAVLEKIGFPGYKNMLLDIKYSTSSPFENIDYGGAIKLAQGLDNDITPFFHDQGMEIIN